MAEPRTVGLVGLGAMARALVAGWARLGQSWSYVGFDPHPDAQDAARSLGVHILPDNGAVAHRADVVVLAVKPNHVARACRALAAAAVTPPPLVLSIAAGVSLETLAQHLGHRRLVRVMPNAPCLVQEGCGAYTTGADVSDADTALVQELLGAVGRFHPVQEERLLDGVTGLSGSGPAFVAVVIEALADAGVADGLPRETALALAIDTVAGTAGLLQHEGLHPAVLKDRVASPGGTTIAGLKALEEAGVRNGLWEAVRRATERARQLGTPGTEPAREADTDPPAP